MQTPLTLITCILLPIGGACLLSFLASLGKEAVRWVALATTTLTLLTVGILLSNYPAHDSVTGFANLDLAWLQTSAGGPLDIRFSLGLDGLSVWLFGLSGLLFVTAVLVSWEAIEDRPAMFYIMLLLLQSGCLGVFAARDIILFYVFFEFTLIPLYFLIGIWGSEDRRYAANKFFLFTLAGSLLTFLGLLVIVFWDSFHNGTGTLRFSIPVLTESLRNHPMPASLQLGVFLALFAGFAIKVPLFPLHTWLPLAHVQAPTAGSVILAGILLKIGGYGFLRFSIPMLPQATVSCLPWIIWLSVLGIVYGALVALAQSDMKRLIAYSSVSHLGFCILGLFALNPTAMQGGTLQLINHGLSTGGLFALVGMIYERYHTREISQLGGLAYRMPWLAFFMLVFTFSSIGLPGLNGFVGEFFVLLGTFQRAFAGTPAAWEMSLRVAAVLAVSGVVLGAWYMLWLVQRVFFGPVKEPAADHSHGAAGHGRSDHQAVGDLSLREILALVPLAVFVVWIGVQPKFFLDRMAPSINQAAVAAESAMQRQFAPQERTAQPWPRPGVEKFSRVH